MTSDSITSSNEQAAASVLGLPLRLEAMLDIETDQKFDRFVHGNQVAREMAAFWLRNILCYAGMALGIYGSLMGGMVFVACMILTLGVSLFLQHRTLANTLSQGVSKEKAPMRVSIEVTEEGMAEMDRGVESRFGWGAMNQWFLSESHLVHSAQKRKMGSDTRERHGTFKYSPGEPRQLFKDQRRTRSPNRFLDCQVSAIQKTSMTGNASSAWISCKHARTGSRHWYSRA